MAETLTAEKFQRRAKAIQQKRDNLQLMRIALMQRQLPSERAMVLMMLVNNEPSFDGQEALHTLILETIQEYKR